MKMAIIIPIVLVVLLGGFYGLAKMKVLPVATWAKGNKATAKILKSVGLVKDSDLVQAPAAPAEEAKPPENLAPAEGQAPQGEPKPLTKNPVTVKDIEGKMKMSKILSDMDNSKLIPILEKMTDEEITELLSFMADDRVTEILAGLPPDRALIITRRLFTVHSKQN